MLQYVKKDYCIVRMKLKHLEPNIMLYIALLWSKQGTLCELSRFAARVNVQLHDINATILLVKGFGEIARRWTEFQYATSSRNTIPRPRTGRTLLNRITKIIFIQI